MLSEDNKILEFDKSPLNLHKAPFIIYADLAHSIEKIDEYKNNFENSSTKK